jgi:hypothetical protein
MDWDELAEKFYIGVLVLALFLLITGVICLLIYEKNSTGYKKGSKFVVSAVGIFGISTFVFILTR